MNDQYITHDQSLLERIPPQNIEAEQSVLGALLVSGEALAKVVDIIKPHHFYRHVHTTIFEAIIRVAESGTPVDLITVSTELRNTEEIDKVGGYSYLMDLAASIPTASNVEYYARIVEEKAVMRELITSGTKIAEMGFSDQDKELDQVIDTAERLIFDVSQSRRKSKDITHIGEILSDTFNDIEDRYENQNAVNGHPTGFYDLDYMTSGLNPSDLIVLAARPAMGKTSLCLNLAQNVAINTKLPTIVFSLEMGKEQLAQRMICSEAKVSSHRVKTGYLAESDWPRLTEAIGKLSEAPIYIDDTPAITVMEVRSKARRLMATTRKNLGLIVIDYLQLMTGAKGDSGNRQQEISTISRSLKALARELNAPVIALSQLSRAVESRTEKRPMLSDLRESGAIEQDSDIVMFIYRDEYYNPESPDKNIAELILAKHRNGPVGTVKLFFENEHTRFDNLTQYNH